jgi:hypothetical protein
MTEDVVTIVTCVTYGKTEAPPTLHNNNNNNNNNNKENSCISNS